MTVYSNLAGFNSESQFNTEIQYGTTGNAKNKQEYIGLAPPGTSLANSHWQIKQFTYNATGQLLRIRFANGSDVFDQAFVNPELLSYS